MAGEDLRRKSLTPTRFAGRSDLIEVIDHRKMNAVSQEIFTSSGVLREPRDIYQREPLSGETVGTNSLSRDKGKRGRRSGALAGGEMLRRHGGNVSATAREMGCSRLTVRRARDGTLEDGDRTPHEQPQKTDDEVFEMVKNERKKTGYGRRRLSRHLKSQFGIILSEHTLRHLLERIDSTKAG